MRYLIFQFKIGVEQGGEWTWSKRLDETVLQQSSESFECLGLCLEDARHNGYSGQLLDEAGTPGPQS